jgi:hypothetical protein
MFRSVCITWEGEILTLELVSDYDACQVEIQEIWGFLVATGLDLESAR